MVWRPRDPSVVQVEAEKACKGLGTVRELLRVREFL